jgi:hypothetical protein
VTLIEQPTAEVENYRDRLRDACSREALRIAKLV